MGFAGADVCVGTVRVNHRPCIRLGGVSVAAGELPVHSQLLTVLEGSYGQGGGDHSQQNTLGRVFYGESCPLPMMPTIGMLCCVVSHP